MPLTSNTRPARSKTCNQHGPPSSPSVRLIEMSGHPLQWVCSLVD